MLRTTHRVHLGDARVLDRLPEGSVHLVVTSPPYPMIAMWDHLFARLDPRAGELLAAGDGMGAFEAMHRALDPVWEACARVLCPGGFACIVVGDATRTVDGTFALYPNHARILQAFARLGFTVLPDVLWRKPTNAPNKFLGSGMLPAGAYVTYEHEHILVFRKGSRRRFSGADRARRARSAFFWEERNAWFSDLWSDLPGAAQRLGPGRGRSAAFPFEVPYRLVQMYSLQGDTILDPFAGTGTTLAAALASGRSSVGIEREPELAEGALAALEGSAGRGLARARRRLAEHLRFVERREREGRPPRHRSLPYGFPVVTRQETRLELLAPDTLDLAGGSLHATCRPVTLPS